CAAPRIRPLWVLRCFTLFGANIVYILCSSGSASATVPAAPSGPGRVGAAAPLLDDLALEDPALHADGSVGREGRHLRVVDVGAERVEGHPSLVVALRPRDLGPAEAARALDLDALRARADRRLDGPLHRAAEGDPLPELVGDVLGHQVGVDLRPLDLLHVHGDLGVREQGELVAELVDLRAALADDHTGPGRVQRDHDLARLALDVHAGERRVRQAATQVLPDRLVLVEEAREVPLRVPARGPVPDDAESEPGRVSLLSHQASLVSTTSVMWLVR